MWPCRSFTDRHHTFKASAQKSLVSRDWLKITVSAPVASINTPNGVHFVPAGGSWSHALGVFPSESVRLFPPPRVVPLVDLRLGVDGDLQGLGVVAVLPAGGLNVGEDGVGVLGLLQRLGLLDPLDPVAHPVEDVAHGALLGQPIIDVTLLPLQRLQDLLGGQVGVAPGGLQLGIGLGVRLDHGADVGGQLRVFDFATDGAFGGEVLDTAEAGAGLVQALLDAVTTPAEASLGGTGAAPTKGAGDLGLERAALVSLEPLGGRANQAVVLRAGMVHRGYPSMRWSDTLYKNPASVYSSPGSFPTASRLSSICKNTLGPDLPSSLERAIDRAAPSPPEPIIRGDEHGVLGRDRLVAERSEEVA